MSEFTEAEKSILNTWQYDKEARTLRHRETWNAAIEAAAEKLEQYCRAQNNNQDETTVAYSIEQIRSLKK